MFYITASLHEGLKTGTLGFKEWSSNCRELQWSEFEKKLIPAMGILGEQIRKELLDSGVVMVNWAGDKDKF
jgi:hypothetical protein